MDVDLFELHYAGVIVNYDYVCEINVCEIVMFTPMRLYRFKVRNVLKSIATEKQTNLLFHHRPIRCKVNTVQKIAHSITLHSARS